MKLKEIREEFYVNTEKASELVRQLAFAGIGIIWVFFLGEKADLNGDIKIIWPLLSLALCLLCDLGQYLYASIVWGNKFHGAEKKGVKLDDEVSVKKKINYPTKVFFYLKIGFLIVSYLSMIVLLVGAL